MVARAWNTPKKLLGPWKLLEIDFFLENSLKFVDIVLEFCWRALEYWNIEDIVLSHHTYEKRI